jgi:hypothetical protein
METETTTPFADVTKLIQQFKVPGLDMAQIIESRRKDMEALVEANKATYEAMQALARRQTEILTQAMQEIQESAKALAAGGSAGADASRRPMRWISSRSGLRRASKR